VRAVRFLRDAEAELVESARWYEENSPGLGARFLDEVERTLAILGEHPEIGRSLGADYRRVLTPRFPYALVYRFVEEEVVVVAVAHTSRRPGYWKDRESGPDEGR
jgi:toxin ParE1/3/4